MGNELNQSHLSDDHSDDAADSKYWIHQLIEGDPEAESEFWETYAPVIRRLADHHLATGLKRRVDADDVLQSVCRTFFRRARYGRFELGSSDELLRLLCAVTLTKVKQHVRFHLRKRRSVNREVSATSTQSAPNQPVPTTPSSEEEVDFVDMFQKLLNELDEEQQQIVMYRLEGLDNEAIAQKMQCTSRTVRRLLAKVHEGWNRQVEKLL
jgi:RNA polymerase sigma-70 factor, ECF subfamily